MIVKVYSNVSRDCKNISADSLETLTEKSEEKFGFEISKFLLKDDHSEIDDEDIFQEMAKHCNPFQLIAIKKGTEFEDSQDLDLLETQERLEKLLLNTGSSTLLSKQKERNSLLEKQIKNLEDDGTLENERTRERQLLDRLKSLTQKTVTTEEARKSKLRTLEDRVAKAEAYRYKISNLFFELKQAEKVDICFLVDCTGSMSPYIQNVKDIINKMVQKLTEKFKHFQIRFSFVGYRDFYNGPDRITVFPFSENEPSFRIFVNSVQAIANCDTCEDVFGGLEEVTKLERFHNSCHDEYPHGDPRGLDITCLLKKIVDLNLNYYFAEINSSTIKMIDEFNKELQKLEGNLIKITKLNSIGDLTQTIIKSVESTIMMSKSLSMSHSKGKSIKPVKILELNWSDLEEEKVEFFNVIQIDTCFKNLKKFSIDFERNKMSIFMASNPFAKGSLRFAYAGKIKNYFSESKKVLKESIFSDDKYNSYEYMKESIENQLVARYLAKEFDKVNPSKKKIRFLDICFVKRLRDGKYFSCEEYTESEFIKFQNNAGYINTDDYSATLHAFIHWTYFFTNGYLIVTDLQGTKNGSEYILTDPAITCPEDFDKFSSTNLGIKGMNYFFKTHECNHICEALKLEKHPKQPLVIQSKNGSLKSILKIKSHNDETDNEKRVSFVDEKLSKNLHEVKPPTIIRDDEIYELDSLERDEISIRECKTIQDIQIVQAQLMEEYTQIQDLKKNKIDVTQKYKNFNLKLDLIEQVKFEIEQKQILNEKIEKEKQNKINLINNKNTKKSNAKKVEFEHKEKETKSTLKNSEILFSQENLFDEIIHKPIDLLILIEFDFRMKKVIDTVKSFLDKKRANNFRVALSWQSSSQIKITNFIDFKNQNLNIDNLDDNSYDNIDQLDWNKLSTRIFYRLYIWEKNSNLFSSKFYEMNKKNFYMVKFDFSNFKFEQNVLNALNEESLHNIFDFIKLKQLFNELFVLKRNQDFDSVHLPSGKIRLNEIKDLNNFKVLSNTINFKINENYLTLNGQKIFNGERASYIDNFTLFFTKPKSEYWFEYFPQKKTIKQFFKIYNTSRYFIEEFNKFFNKKLIVLSEIKFFFDDSHYQSKIWYSNHVDLDTESFKELNFFRVMDSVCQAFMHYTYVKSKQKFIIFDLRPVYSNEKECLIFTEPVIQSMDATGNFSKADLGLNGIEYFFLKRHCCNNLCNKFLQN
ncbi:unnamed protein product [Brachionus calyciflorus]|uniref:Uncharacterized protein n=1 Tax=Brachionus calyciflorus TaxID=104777 RepID=A0A813U2T7_9BILA|nr:unnamed protein product [Brachionus calyciflorus]